MECLHIQSPILIITIRIYINIFLIAHDNGNSDALNELSRYYLDII
jgi:hypothetical protein